MRLAASCLALTGMLVVTGCGSSEKAKRRDAVNAYLNRVNAIDHRFARSFALANDAYRTVGTAKPGKRKLQQLQAAEVAMIAARASLQRVSPPPDARKLHAMLLKLYDLDAALGLEVVSLQKFLPGVRKVLGKVGRLNDSYRKQLGRATTADAQAAAIKSYANRLDPLVDELQRVETPGSLLPWKRDQVKRFRQVITTGRNLALALETRQATVIDPLVRRFQFFVSRRPNVSQAQHDAVKAYNNRLIRASRLQGDIQRERERLQNELG